MIASPTYLSIVAPWLSFALAFVVLPLVLHKPTRDILPGRASTAFAGWIAEHSPSLVEFPNRVLRLIPVSRESLLFLVQHKVLAFEAGGLIPGNKPIARTASPSQVTDDVEEARGAAALLGRWFANQGSPSTIMLGFGVSP
jgi:hypothetical protein